MFSDNLNKIDFTLYEPQIDIILHSLELYAYNLHFISNKFCEEYEYINILLYHTYQEILAHYSNYRFNSGYDPSYNCKLEIDRIKKRRFYRYKKNFVA